MRAYQTISEVITRIGGNSILDEETDCLLWQGAAANGYGEIWWDGKQWLIHRLIFDQVNGYLPKIVRHSCDTPRCWNPEHLLGGTHYENAQDKMARDRHCYGERHWNVKLTEIDVRQIRASDLTVPELQAKYGMSRGAISCILRYATWKHVR